MGPIPIFYDKLCFRYLKKNLVTVAKKKTPCRIPDRHDAIRFISLTTDRLSIATSTSEFNWIPCKRWCWASIWRSIWRGFVCVALGKSPSKVKRQNDIFRPFIPFDYCQFFFFFDLIFNIYSTGKSWSTHLGFLFGCCVSMYDAILRKTSVTCYLGTVSFISFYYLCCFVFIWTFIELERAGWLIWSPVDLWLIIKEVLRNDSLEGLWFSSELGKTCSVLSHTTCWTNRLNGIIEEIVRIQP